MTATTNGQTPPLEGIARVPEHVVYRTFVRETVILNLETGKYHGLNPTGGRMLEVLTSAANVRDAVAALADEYAQPFQDVAQDVEGFCLDLVARGLIEISPNGHH